MAPDVTEMSEHRAVSLLWSSGPLSEQPSSLSGASDSCLFIVSRGCTAQMVLVSAQGAGLC